MTDRKNFGTFLILITIFLLVSYLALFAGYKDFGLHLLRDFFTKDSQNSLILMDILRIPRFIKGLIAGSCLALSGMLLQSVSKNPLAEPYITGISSGAGLGIVFSVLFFGGISYSLFGFAGALITALIVILLCGFGKFSITKLVLIGLSVNMFAGSVISFLILKNPEKSYSLMYILTGNITENAGVSDNILLLIFACAIFVSALFFFIFNLLRLDSELIGNRKKYDVIVVILSSFFAALSVLNAGILSFTGIIAPQISKMIIGGDYRFLFFANILIGASFTLFADFLSRVILYPVQIPLGLVIAFIGSPVFVYFLLKKGVISND